MERLDAALAHDVGTGFALLLMDLDDFKVINDRHGHASGDAVLEVIGARLVATVRTSDTVARLGGDEFALLLSGTPASVRRTAERLVEQIVAPIEVGGRRFLVRASIGVVFLTPGDVETPHSLLSHADIALYEAKARDKGGIVVIDGPERDAAAKQVFLREQIAQPVLEEFSVVYQPIVDLGTGVVRGVEALLRWQHPELAGGLAGRLHPDVGVRRLDPACSAGTLTEACSQLARWRTELPDQRLAVGINVSSGSSTAGVRQTGLRPGRPADFLEHRLGDLLLELDLLGRVVPLGPLDQHDAALVAGLGLVERDVGVRQQRLRRSRMSRSPASTMPMLVRTLKRRPPTDRLLDGLHQPLGDGPQSSAVPCTSERELVTAEPGDRVLAPHQGRSRWPITVSTSVARARARAGR